eukprot:1138373-Pelagomonas_calceolata.AAC.2
MFLDVWALNLPFSTTAHLASPPPQKPLGYPCFRKFQAFQAWAKTLQILIKYTMSSHLGQVINYKLYWMKQACRPDNVQAMLCQSRGNTCLMSQHAHAAAGCPPMLLLIQHTMPLDMKSWATRYQASACSRTPFVELELRNGSMLKGGVKWLPRSNRRLRVARGERLIAISTRQVLLMASTWPQGGALFHSFHRWKFFCTCAATRPGAAGSQQVWAGLEGTRHDMQMFGMAGLGAYMKPRFTNKT